MPERETLTHEEISQLIATKEGYIKFKRVMDVLLSGTAIVVLSPVLGATALLIKMDSPGPVMFKQKRVGKNKEHFEIWKFRTMRTDTPKDMPTHMLSNPDAFITKTGKFLRKTSLDELPQLFNIFKGEMSIIGPRPALWNQFDLIEERDKYGANDVTPGLTGWAQINGRDELEIPVKARLDVNYVEQLGIKYDLMCFFGTIGSVLSHDGVVEGGTGKLSKNGRNDGIYLHKDIKKHIAVGAAVSVGAAAVGLAALGFGAKYISSKKKSPSTASKSCKGLKVLGGIGVAAAVGVAAHKALKAKKKETSKKKYMIFTNHSYMLWQFRKELIEELMKSGEVVLAMPFVGHEEDFKLIGCRCIEVNVDRRGINPATDIKLYQKYVRLLKAENPDMVITYSIKPNVYGGFACGQLGIPFCANVQGLGTAFQKKGLDKVVTMMYKVALRNAKTVFFENQSNADEFIQRGILNENKIKVLNGAGVNLEHYAYKEYPFEDSGIHILFLGRIMKEKGIDELFEAAVQIKKKYGDRVIFDLVGFFEDEYKDKVEEFVENGIVVFHGFQEEPRPFYEMAHCVVLPSYHEGMSNVLLEAAATGRAIITSNIPGCREAVDNGKNGYLVQVKKSHDLTEKIDAFLSLDTEQRKAMGVSGREKMKMQFDKKSVVSETLEGIGVANVF